MPVGLIEEHDRVRTWGTLGDFVEMELRDFALQAGSERGAGPALGPHQTDKSTECVDS
jgi:hypothetical protein